MNKVSIKNVSSAKVSLYMPEIHIQRELLPGQVFNLDREVYDDLILDQGVEALFAGHYLTVLSGLEPDEVPVNNDNVVSATDIGKMLDDLDVAAFAKFIPNAAPAEREAVVDLAVAKKVTHPGFTQLIKKYCGRDVIELINMRHQEEI